MNDATNFRLMFRFHVFHFPRNHLKVNNKKMMWFNRDTFTSCYNRICFPSVLRMRSMMTEKKTTVDFSEFYISITLASVPNEKSPFQNSFFSNLFKWSYSFFFIDVIHSVGIHVPIKLKMLRFYFQVNTRSIFREFYSVDNRSIAWSMACHKISFGKPIKKSMKLWSRKKEKS